MNEALSTLTREHHALVCKPRGHVHPMTPADFVECALLFLAEEPHDAA